jgi:predicted RNase H-like HicB family nuclease
LWYYNIALVKNYKGKNNKMDKSKLCYIVLTAIIKKEGHVFVATCQELGIATQGISIGRANRNLKEAVRLYIDSTQELGIWDDIVKEKNIRIVDEVPQEKNVKSIHTETSQYTTIISEPIPIFC